MRATTDLQKGIIDGMTLRDWWENTPHGAFMRKCTELKIPLHFGDGTEVLADYEVEIEYRYSGTGRTYIKVQAFNEEEAERLALDKLDESDVDTYDVEIDRCKCVDFERTEIQSSRESE